MIICLKRRIRFIHKAILIIFIFFSFFYTGLFDNKISIKKDLMVSVIFFGFLVLEKEFNNNFIFVEGIYLQVNNSREKISFI